MSVLFTYVRQPFFSYPSTFLSIPPFPSLPYPFSNVTFSSTHIANKECLIPSLPQSKRTALLEAVKVAEVAPEEAVVDEVAVVAAVTVEARPAP